MKPKITILLCLFLVFAVCMNSFALTYKNIYAYESEGVKLTPSLIQSGPPLIFVDIPETISTQHATFEKNEIVATYRDKTNQNFRLMYYHFNKSKEKLYFSVVLTNQSDKNITIKYNSKTFGFFINNNSNIANRLIRGNQNNYDKIAANLKPKSSQVFNSKLVKPDQLASLVSDFSTNEYVTISVIISKTYLSRYSLSNDKILNSKILAHDGKPHVRGKFDHSVLSGTINLPENKKSYLHLGNDDLFQNDSPYLPNEKILGTSSINDDYSKYPNNKLNLAGNYGVDYFIKFEVPSNKKYKLISYGIPNNTQSRTSTYYFSGLLLKDGKNWKTLSVFTHNNESKELCTLDSGSYTLKTTVVGGYNHPLRIMFEPISK